MGRAYQSGLGVDPDWGKAIKWWRKAAGRGHVSAMLNLVRVHDDPDDDMPDPVTPDEALKWLKKAAGAGNPSALAQLDFWGSKLPAAAGAGG